MKATDILKERNERGILSTGNDNAGWHAISRDGVHMITFYMGKFTFTQKDDVNIFYKNEMSFAKRIVQLINRGY